MTIGLFNRVRSQNGSTKFLGTESMGWVARNNVWDTFIIRAVAMGASYSLRTSGWGRGVWPLTPAHGGGAGGDDGDDGRRRPARCVRR